MTDLISKIRREQEALAVPIASQLFRELKPYLANGKLTLFSDYIPSWNLKEGDTIDIKAAEAMVKSDLRREAVLGIKGYTDWAASRIVNNNDYTIVAPCQIDYKLIGEIYDIAFKSLERIISYMHAKEKLPLLGKIRNGRFNPDPAEFEQWKNLYDWNKK